MDERMDGVERSGDEDNDGVGLEKGRVEKRAVLMVNGVWESKYSIVGRK